MAYCDNCGTKIGARAKFCGECGAARVMLAVGRPNRRAR